MEKPGSFQAATAVRSTLQAAILLFASAACCTARAEPPVEPSASPQDWNRFLVTRGHASEQLGQKADALADYTLAIESRALLDNDLAQALFDRGLLMDGMGRPADALADYNAALSLIATFLAALDNRAGIYLRLGQLSKARQDYLAMSVTGGQQSPHAYFGLGKVAEAAGDKAAARDFHDHATKVDPNFGPAGERLAALKDADRSFDQLLASAAREGAIGGEKNTPISSPEPALHDAQVQLGAWRSHESATRGWDHALMRAGTALEGRFPLIVAVDLPGTGRFYRLRVAVEQSSSKGFCTALEAKGLDCMVVRNR
jgi:tetratricopeptide (TPR) repeat protein